MCVYIIIFKRIIFRPNLGNWRPGRQPQPLPLLPSSQILTFPSSLRPLSNPSTRALFSRHRPLTFPTSQLCRWKKLTNSAITKAKVRKAQSQVYFKIIRSTGCPVILSRILIGRYDLNTRILVNNMRRTPCIVYRDKQNFISSSKSLS